MILIVDENLPRRLAVWLCSAGHSARHVSDLGLLGLSDEVIWNAALRDQAGIVTRVAISSASRARPGAGSSFAC